MPVEYSQIKAASTSKRRWQTKMYLGPYPRRL